MAAVFLRAKWAFFTFFTSIFVLSLLYRSTSRHSWELENFHSPLDDAILESISSDTESHHNTTCPPFICQCPEPQHIKEEKEEVRKPWDSHYALQGVPTKHFRDNLRPDMYYMTAWTFAGFTNQFMALVNMIYLATITDRIPIVPPFAPSHHISASAGVIPFGDLFNLTHLRDALQKPVLEWKEVKELPSPEDPYYNPNGKEHLGCWSTRQEDERDPFPSDNTYDHLGLDVSYTRVPGHVRRIEHPKDHQVVFSELSALTFPETPSNNPTEFPLMYSSPMDFKLAPDQHMTCFDFLYYASSGRTFYEWEQPWSPAWRNIGKNLHFTDRMVTMAKYYLSTTFGTHPDEIPKFIAIHARRGDFARQCFDTTGECLPPLSAYSQKVQDIQEELLRKRGLSVHEVIITSDEKDPEFWEQVKGLGWKSVDHDVHRTVAIFGEWYPPLIDIVIQSMAVGFVGTSESTFSLVSKRRVQDWNDGVTRTVVKGGW